MVKWIRNLSLKWLQESKSCPACSHWSATSSSGSYLEDDTLRLAYLSYYLPANVAKVQSLLDELPADAFEPSGPPRPLEVLDVGAGLEKRRPYVGAEGAFGVSRGQRELRELKGKTQAWLCNETDRPEVGRLDRDRSAVKEAVENLLRGAIVKIEPIAWKAATQRREGLGRVTDTTAVEVIRPIGRGNRKTRTEGP